MIVPFVDRVAGTTVYINPAYVMTLRPEPAEPERASVLELEDGETIQMLADHAVVANKLAVPEREPS